MVRNAKSGELSIAAGANLANMPYASYLRHLGEIGFSMLDATDLSAELDALTACAPTSKGR